MMMKAFDLSVGVFVRGLGNLKVLLEKAEAHASSRGLEPTSLLDARLAEDMYTLATQVHWAGEGAKLAVQRLIGTVAPPSPEPEKTFAALRERIDTTIAGLRVASPEALEAGLERTIELPHRGGPTVYRGDRFLTEFAIPTFFFHMTAAYAILRNAGVPVQKGDFLGI